MDTSLRSSLDFCTLNWCMHPVCYFWCSWYLMISNKYCLAPRIEIMYGWDGMGVIRYQLLLSSCCTFWERKNVSSVFNTRPVPCWFVREDWTVETAGYFHYRMQSIQRWGMNTWGTASCAISRSMLLRLWIIKDWMDQRPCNHPSNERARYLLTYHFSFFLHPPSSHHFHLDATAFDWF